MTLRVPAPLRLTHLTETDSTNRVAMAAARAGAPSGLVVLADTQTAGRGRQGRRWLDHASSLLVSVMLRPRTPLRTAWAYTFVAGLGALDVARDAGVLDAWLKWPNDLWVGERKAGGVLCELSSQGGELEAVVLGVGLNLGSPAQGWPVEIQGTAASLGSASAPLDRGEALDSLCAGVLRWEGRLRDEGPDSLIEAAREAMQPMVGRSVTAQVHSKSTSCTVLGIGQNGALRLRTSGGEELAMLAGDVHLTTAD